MHTNSISRTIFLIFNQQISIFYWVYHSNLVIIFSSFLSQSQAQINSVNKTEQPNIESKYNWLFLKFYKIQPITVKIAFFSSFSLHLPYFLINQREEYFIFLSTSISWDRSSRFQSCGPHRTKESCSSQYPSSVCSFSLLQPQSSEYNPNLSSATHFAAFIFPSFDLYRI